MMRRLLSFAVDIIIAIVSWIGTDFVMFKLGLEHWIWYLIIFVIFSSIQLSVKYYIGRLFSRF